jgi:hypothetical protein
MAEHSRIIRPMTRRDFLILSGAAAAYPFLPGCGGGGGTEPQGDFFTARNVVIKPNVFVIPEDGSVTVSGLTDSGLTLSGTLPTLTPGSMLVSGQGPGFIRRVMGVTPVGTTLSLITQTGSLEDVIESAEVRFRKKLNQEPEDTIQVHAPGVQIGRSAGRQDTPEGIPIHVPEFKVARDEEGTEFAAKFAANGILNFDVDGEFIFTLANGLERFGLSLTADYNGTFLASTEAETPFIGPREIEFATFIGSPRRLGAIGPIPILLLPVLFIQVVYKGAAKAGFRTRTNGGCRFHLVLGFTARKLSSGDYHFDGLFVPTRNGNFDSPNFFGAVEFELIPWQFELQTSLDGLIGPVFKANMPAVKAAVEPHPIDKFVDVKLEAAFGGSAGAQAGMFGLTLPIWEVPFEIRKFDIPPFPKRFGPGDSITTVH